MELVLPPGVTRATYDRALRRFAGVVGADWVFSTDEDRDTFLDPYAIGDAETYAAGASVAPKSVEEVQAILRIATELKVPMWPFSRGKNLGYGGGSPCVSGTVLLDLSRMNRILEVNEKYGYIVVEPGVGFFDLFDHLQKNKIKLWMSAPAQTWGSVMGNALDRGIGYTPYGDHASKMCGLEVVLPTGEVVRTGMGAMPGSTTWHLARPGFGPSWEGVFQQSNYGVVTKMGLWMLPEPEMTLGLAFEAQRDEDIIEMLDTLRPLKMDGTLQAAPNMGNAIRGLASRGPRELVWQGTGPMPEEAIEAARKKYDIGRWNFSTRLFGYEEVVLANAKIIKDRFSKTSMRPDIRENVWKPGDPVERSGQAIPSLTPLNIVNWLGGRGGHITFSPISAFSGDDAYRQYRSTRALYEKAGFDYSGGFTTGERFLTHTSMIFYDRTNEDMTARSRTLFKALVKNAAAMGAGEYRTHVRYYDEVAAAYDWNNNALRRMNAKVKDALDPAGILAPGRMGIWPKDKSQVKKA
jgi:4-cresol dehydrogenase (hydroxylating)